MVFYSYFLIILVRCGFLQKFKSFLEMALYIFVYIYIYILLKIYIFLEEATESWPEWDLNPRPLNSVPTL